MAFGLGIMAIASVVASAGWFLEGWLARRSRRAFREMRSVEITRSRFAELRARLLLLEADGEIGIRTKPFQHLWAFYTFILRNPLNYRHVGNLLALMLMVKLRQDEAFRAELESLPRNAKGLIVDTARAIDLLLLDHSDPGTVRANYRKIKMDAEASKSVREVREVQDRMLHLASVC